MAARALAVRSATPLDDALAFIEAHFDEPVRLEQLAALSALSISHFVTAFRKRFGLSPYRYLCDLRIRRAQTLLLSGMPGSVVAAEVGFFDQSHFGRHFKRFCGMTPSGYVRAKQADDGARPEPGVPATGAAIGPRARLHGVAGTAPRSTARPPRRPGRIANFVEDKTPSYAGKGA